MIALNDAILPEIYATAEDESRWVPVLDQLRRQFGAGNAVVQILEEGPRQFHCRWEMRDSFSQTQADRHDTFLNNADNPRLGKEVLARSPTAMIVRDTDYRVRSQMRFSDLQHKLKLAGLGQAICAVLPLSRYHNFSLVLHRKEGDDRDFGEEEEALLRALLPHVQQAARLFMKVSGITASAAMLQSAIDRLRTGIMFCNPDLRVHWMNQAARAMIDRSRHVTMARDELRCVHAGDGADLRRLAASALAEGPGPWMTVIGRHEGNPLQIMAAPGSFPAPLGGQDMPGPALALLMSEPAQAPDFAAEDIAALFDLSPAEARLAAAIAQGLSLSDYSRQRGVSIGTARIQMKQVLAKMQADRQANMVRQLCGSISAQTLMRPMLDG